MQEGITAVVLLFLIFFASLFGMPILNRRNTEEGNHKEAIIHVITEAVWLEVEQHQSSGNYQDEGERSSGNQL